MLQGPVCMCSQMPVHVIASAPVLAALDRALGVLMLPHVLPWSLSAGTLMIIHYSLRLTKVIKTLT